MISERIFVAAKEDALVCSVLASRPSVRHYSPEKRVAIFGKT